MHSAIVHPSLGDAQPDSKQQSQHLANFLPSLYADHDIIQYGISLWPVWVSCPGCAPSHLLVHLPSQQSVGSCKSP